ncbi:hypothetical protein MLD38_006587 [Melastoma candidum]|uniref:Uncharacterized protein n=1 Tax=Melastoma candidum TaxID=119954 RepID=A0ACB9RRD0_9MYRT|nr:hypothetical protein MLD38_006587 [Melastoma candidum]
MGCFRCAGSRTQSPIRDYAVPSSNKVQVSSPRKQEVLLRIPSCSVHLMEDGQAVELCKGEFSLVRVWDGDVPLVTTVKVGDELQWPVTKDEPVVKLDTLHYLFTLPVKDGDPLSYGVTFPDKAGGSLGLLDSFLNEHSCFSAAAPSSASRKNNIDWTKFAPKIEDYNGFLAKAIAGGTGQIIKGIFQCSNAYTNQVHRGGEMLIARAAEGESTSYSDSLSNTSDGARKKSALNRNLKRVRKVSKMTERISKSMLDGIQFATGSVMGPVVKSQAGKAFLSMVPGEVLLASLDALNRVLDAAEAAEKQAFTETSKAASGMVSRRFGEDAGEATEDVLATAGHCAGTAWNIFKIRKAINPATSVSSGALRSAAKAANTAKTSHS